MRKGGLKAAVFECWVLENWGWGLGIRGAGEIVPPCQVHDPYVVKFGARQKIPAAMLICIGHHSIICGCQ